MRINELKTTFKRKKRKTIGRGGKKGNSSGRGTKGQKARTGGRSAAHLAGLRSSIIRRMPKLPGFKSLYPKFNVVSVELLDKNFNDNETVSPSILFQKKIIKSAGKVKILGNGNISKKLTIQNCYISLSAKEKIEKAGGKVQIPDAEKAPIKK